MCKSCGLTEPVHLSATIPHIACSGLVALAILWVPAGRDAMTEPNPQSMPAISERMYSCLDGSGR